MPGSEPITILAELQLLHRHPDRLEPPALRSILQSIERDLVAARRRGNLLRLTEWLRCRDEARALLQDAEDRA